MQPCSNESSLEGLNEMQRCQQEAIGDSAGNHTVVSPPKLKGMQKTPEALSSAHKSSTQLSLFKVPPPWGTCLGQVLRKKVRGSHSPSILLNRGFCWSKHQRTDCGVCRSVTLCRSRLEMGGGCHGKARQGCFVCLTVSSEYILRNCAV